MNRSLFAVLAVLALPAAAQDKPPERVRGEVAALNGNDLDLRTRDNQTVHLKLAPQVGVAAAEKADASAIQDGTFIGTAAVAEPDGTLRALEVHVFPESMRGTGEGHRPWDLGPASSMTNGAVAAMRPGKPASGAAKGTGSSMTNATVAANKAKGGARTLTLKYAGGEQTVVVPPDVPIVRLAPGDRSLLVPGAHVFAIANRQDDGSLLVQRLTVGKGGLVPPM
ncbi:MAG TPA: hypothetical protein VFG59_12920 [Anaeromyxobacter sp.]|nr:hypothetical protein [Anaeromyxobacter sp.]